jgi:hypothetical protein
VTLPEIQVVRIREDREGLFPELVEGFVHITWPRPRGSLFVPHMLTRILSPEG